VGYVYGLGMVAFRVMAITGPYFDFDVHFTAFYGLDREIIVWVENSRPVGKIDYRGWVVFTKMAYLHRQAIR
jgi:hypothetical protein